jgi:hypothetical protein
MTPWHRFWLPQGDDLSPSLPRDAALWTPQALAETQRAFWQQAALATEDWWRFCRSAWPSVADPPPAGAVAPRPVAEAKQATTRSTPARKTRPRSQAAPPAAAPRPRRAARGA